MYQVYVDVCVCVLGLGIAIHVGVLRDMRDNISFILPFNGMSNLLYLNVNTDASTKHNPCHAKFRRRLAKVTQTTSNKCTPSNDAIIAMVTTLNSRKNLLLQSVAYRGKTSNSLLNFCLFLNSNIDLELDCIFERSM